MSKPRVLVIGLDGATWDLIRPWAAAGHLPHLSRLLDEGSGGPLLSTIPPVSAAAWSSFMTGKNPGKHGVFDFTVRDFRGYGMRLTQRPPEPTLWRLLSDRGRSVCVVNVPQTYPPEAIQGAMVTGLGTPSQRVFTYPPELTSSLRRAGYRTGAEATLQRDGAVRFEEEVHQVAELVADTSLRLMGQLDWDLAVVVLRLTDEIPHFFWHWMDPGHPAHQPTDAFHSQAIRRCYAKADALVGKLVAAVQDDATTVIVMSDHGFGPLYKDVYLNEWLRQEGFLRLRPRHTPRTAFVTLLQHLGLTRTQVGHALSRWGLHGLRGALRDKLAPWADLFPQDDRPRVDELVDWGSTSAYSVGYIGQIYVNLAGRDPLGVVAPGQEYEELRNRLVARLRQMADPEDGRPVVDEVLRKEEVYRGPYVANAPDLLLIMRGLSYITRQGGEYAGANRIFLPPPTHETGGHRQQGILLMWGGSVAARQWIGGAHIEDLAPTVLHLLGCEIPGDMDGEPLVQLLAPEFLATHPVRLSGPSPESGPTPALTPEEEKDLLRRLRDLGYVS